MCGELLSSRSLNNAEDTTAERKAGNVIELCAKKKKPKRGSVKIKAANVCTREGERERERETID